jgi:hypothetical protein
MSKRKRFQFRNSDTAGAARLNGPLNEFATDIQLRLEALEASLSSVLLLEDVQITTGAAVAVNTAPFPMVISVKNFTPAAVLVGRVENLSGPATIATSAHAVQWRMSSDNTIELQLVTGLAVNSKYRLTLVAIA